MSKSECKPANFYIKPAMFVDSGMIQYFIFWNV